MQNCFQHCAACTQPLLQESGAQQEASHVSQVHSLSVRAKGKLLLENTQLSVTAGRRYGLVGPNGKGKSTLLRLIARRQIPVPEGLDVLLVEQVWCSNPGVVSFASESRRDLGTPLLTDLVLVVPYPIDLVVFHTYV